MTFPFSLVIFDLDGTLVDSAAAIAVAVNRTLEDWKLPRVDDARIVEWIGEGSRQLITYAFRDAYTDHFIPFANAGWKVLMLACYAPLNLWGPALLVLTWAYYRRRVSAPAVVASVR